MKIALCQMKVVMDKEENLKKAEQLIESAAEKGAEVVVLPEMFICPYSNAYFREYSEVKGGESYKRLSSFAKNNQVLLVAGSVPEYDDDKVYNTSYVFDATGICIGAHRKAHMFDIDVPGGIRFMESETLTPGNQHTVVDTPYGKMGVAICYDMRFPEFFRKMALEGASFIVVPAAFNMTTGPAHWELTARVRALDNQVFMALCSPARDEDGVYVAYGHSMVTTPWGEVGKSLAEDEGILLYDIELNRCEEVRASLPLLKHRRPELY